MSLQHNHLKHLHVEKKTWPLELSNIASTVASLPQSLCSSCPLWHHASQELGGQEGADHVSQTLLLTGFKDGLSRESELGEGRWTSSLTFVPVTVAIATMACIQEQQWPPGSPFSWGYRTHLTMSSNRCLQQLVDAPFHRPEDWLWRASPQVCRGTSMAGQHAPSSEAWGPQESAPGSWLLPFCCLTEGWYLLPAVASGFPRHSLWTNPDVKSPL